MKKYLLIIALSLAVIISCEKEKNYSEKKYSGLVIAMGSICGWCGGADSLRITKEKSYYEFTTFCEEKGYIKDTVTNKNEWSDLLEEFDIEEFQKIEINTCYVCADGCDLWISIQNGSVLHKITFGYNDSVAIQSILPFVRKLDSIRTRFRNDDNK